MKNVKISPSAQQDIREIYSFLINRGASEETAQKYMARLLSFLSKLDVFPERGTLRSDIRAGLRVIGFERRISVAFLIEQQEVIILRLLYAGKQLENL